MNLIGTIQRWLAQDVRTQPGPADDFWYGPFYGSTATGVYVDSKTALRANAVWACVRVIAESLSTLPCNIYRRRPDGGKEIAYDHPIFSKLNKQPNEYQTAFEFWEQCAVHLLTAGNAFARITYGGKNSIASLKWLQPALVTVKSDTRTGIKFYEVRSDVGAPSEVLFDDHIWHIPGMGYDGLAGYNPIHMQTRSVEMMRASEEYGARFFGNNAAPPQYISFPGVLPKDFREQLLEWFNRRFGGLSNSHKLGVLENGGEIKTVPINHQQIQLIELRKFQVEEIARIFRVPLHMIQHLDRATNNNIEHQSMDFATHTLRPWCERIEARVDSFLLGPRESQQYFCEFDMKSLLRADAIARSQFYASQINNALATPNEIRLEENRNPLPGGDKLYIQGAMVPLENAGMPAEPTPKAAA